MQHAGHVFLRGPFGFQLAGQVVHGPLATHWVEAIVAIGRRCLGASPAAGDGPGVKLSAVAATSDRRTVPVANGAKAPGEAAGPVAQGARAGGEVADLKGFAVQAAFGVAAGRHEIFAQDLINVHHGGQHARRQQNDGHGHGIFHQGVASLCLHCHLSIALI